MGGEPYRRRIYSFLRRPSGRCGDACVPLLLLKGWASPPASSLGLTSPCLICRSVERLAVISADQTPGRTFSSPPILQADQMETLYRVYLFRRRNPAGNLRSLFFVMWTVSHDLTQACRRPSNVLFAGSHSLLTEICPENYPRCSARIGLRLSCDTRDNVQVPLRYGELTPAHPIATWDGRSRTGATLQRRYRLPASSEEIRHRK